MYPTPVYCYDNIDFYPHPTAKGNVASFTHLLSLFFLFSWFLPVMALRVNSRCTLHVIRVAFPPGFQICPLSVARYRSKADIIAYVPPTLYLRQRLRSERSTAPHYSSTALAPPLVSVAVEYDDVSFVFESAIRNDTAASSTFEKVIQTLIVSTPLLILVDD